MKTAGLDTDEVYRSSYIVRDTNMQFTAFLIVYIIC